MTSRQVLYLTLQSLLHPHCCIQHPVRYLYPFGTWRWLACNDVKEAGTGFANLEAGGSGDHGANQDARLSG